MDVTDKHSSTTGALNPFKHGTKGYGAGKPRLIEHHHRARCELRFCILIQKPALHGLRFDAGLLQRTHCAVRRSKSDELETLALSEIPGDCKRRGFSRASESVHADDTIAGSQ